MSIYWNHNIFDEEYEKNKHYKNQENNLNIFDDDEIDDIKEQKMLQTFDSDLLKYFNDARIMKKKCLINKKVKKEKNIFITGDKVKFNNICGTIIYGPYEKNDKIFYEIESNNGIASIEYKGNNIQKI